MNILCTALLYVLWSRIYSKNCTITNIQDYIGDLIVTIRRQALYAAQLMLESKDVSKHRQNNSGTIHKQDENMFGQSTLEKGKIEIFQ